MNKFDKHDHGNELLSNRMPLSDYFALHNAG